MSRRTVLLILSLLLTWAARAQSPKLTFVEQIGTGWDTDKWGWMSFVAFSADGTMVAADASTSRADVSGDLTLWSFPEGRFLRRIPGAPAVLSPDWKFYANSHEVGRLDGGKPVISVGKNAYAGFAFSSDSRYVAESLPGAHNAGIRVVELASGRQVSALGKHHPFSLAFSPDGRTLAAGHFNAVMLWNLASGEREAVLRGGGRCVEGLAFSPDGRLLAAGDDLGSVRIWDLQTNRLLHATHVDGQVVSDPAFSPDGRLLAFGVYGTGTVWLVDVSSGKIVDHRQVSGIGCGSVAFSPDGKYLITPSTGGLIKWPYDRGGTIRVFRIDGLAN